MNESLRKADPYLQNPTKLQGLGAQVQKKMGRVKVPISSVSAGLNESLTSAAVMGRMVKAYGKGRYRRVPWGALGAIAAALIYFITPTDFIPDFIVAAGLLDDATIIALVAKSVSSVLAEFRLWERQQPVEATATEVSDAPAADDEFTEIPITLDPS